jgi:hypothetical protein
MHAHSFARSGGGCRLLSGISRARRSGCLPPLHLRSKLLMRHRNRIPTFTRIPAPRHHFIFPQVLDQLIEVAVLVLLRVLNRTANLRVAKALPNHWRGWRRKSPIGRTGRHVRASEILFLMARAALFGGHPVTFRAASHVHGVPMPVISLPREVTARMAVHAAGMPQHGDKFDEKGPVACRRSCGAVAFVAGLSAALMGCETDIAPRKVRTAPAIAKRTEVSKRFIQPRSDGSAACGSASRSRRTPHSR